MRRTFASRGGVKYSIRVMTNLAQAITVKQVLSAATNTPRSSLDRHRKKAKGA